MTRLAGSFHSTRSMRRDAAAELFTPLANKSGKGDVVQDHHANQHGRMIANRFTAEAPARAPPLAPIGTIRIVRSRVRGHRTALALLLEGEFIECLPAISRKQAPGGGHAAQVVALTHCSHPCFGQTPSNRRTGRPSIPSAERKCFATIRQIRKSREDCTFARPRIDPPLLLKFGVQRHASRLGHRRPGSLACRPRSCRRFTATTPTIFRPPQLQPVEKAGTFRWLT
jgi:hypothetical protein